MCISRFNCTLIEDGCVVWHCLNVLVFVSKCHLSAGVGTCHCTSACDHRCGCSPAVKGQCASGDVMNHCQLSARAVPRRRWLSSWLSSTAGRRHTLSAAVASRWVVAARRRTRDDHPTNPVRHRHTDTDPVRHSQTQVSGLSRVDITGRDSVMPGDAIPPAAAIRRRGGFQVRSRVGELLRGCRPGLLPGRRGRCRLPGDGMRCCTDRQLVHWNQLQEELADVE